MSLHSRSNDPASQDEGPAIIAVSVGLMSIGFLLVLIRLSYRVQSTGIKADDILITFAVILSLGHSVDDCISVIQYGYGKHEVDLTPAQAHAGRTTGAALGFWISQIFYKLSLLCTKLSICFLYRRIFERARKSFTIALFLVMALVGAYYTAAVLATVFECTPVSKSWIKSQPGHCISLTTFFFANAAFNISTDVVIMLLPVPVIYSLHLPLRQRILLCCIFAVGLFATATSVIRSFTLKQTGAGVDTTWEVAGSTLWSSVEINVTIICACLPMLRPPLQALFPRFFRSLSNHKYGSDQYSSDQYGSGQYGYRAGYSGHSFGGDRFSKRFSMQITPGASQYSKDAEVGLRTIGESLSEGDRKRSDQQSDDQPYFIIDEDSEGILKRTEVTIVCEENGTDSRGRHADKEGSYLRRASSETVKRESQTPGLAL